MKASPKLVRKQGKVYLSSKHRRRGYFGGVRYQNRVLSKYLSLCTRSYPVYSAYKSLIHRVNFGQFKLSTDIYKNPGPSVYVDATKTIHAPYCRGNVVVFGENAGHVVHWYIAMSCQIARKHRYSSFEYCEMEPLKKKHLVTRRKENRQIGVKIFAWNSIKIK